MKKNLLLLCALLAIMVAQAQPITGDSIVVKSKAEALYESLSFGLYIEAMTQKIQSGATLTTLEQLHLADSYLFTGGYAEAIKWYSQSVNESVAPIYKYRYAQVLQSNGDCPNAKKWYQAYEAAIGVDTLDAQRLSANMDCIDGQQSAIAIAHPFTIENVASVNSPKYDFSPSWYKDGFVFVSNNLSYAGNRLIDKWLNDNFMNLYEATPYGESAFAVRPFSDRLNSKYHEGPVTFGEAGRVMYFTRNNMDKGKLNKDKTGLTALKIYQSTHVEGSWSEPVALPFNREDVVACHPAMHPDGQTLYFAASYPDTKGKLDLYVVTRNGGTWSEPRNLGLSVNSIGNDAFPYVDAQGVLYFASDRPGSKGGWDLYRAIPDGEGWKVANLGAPFNTSQDDFGLIVSPDGTSGYFTSNRDGGQGLDDIYRFEAQLINGIKPSLVEKERDNAQPVASKVGGLPLQVLSPNRSPLPGVQLKMYPIADPTEAASIPKNAQPQAIFFSDANGEAELPLAPRQAYLIVIEKPGYSPQRMALPADDRSAWPSEVILTPLAEVQLIGLAIDADARKPLPHAPVSIKNLSTGEITPTRADATDNFVLQLPCGADYEVQVKADSYESEVQRIAANSEDCPTMKMVNLWAYPTQATIGDQTIALTAGAVIELRRIFYDFDRYEIRTDASTDLSELADLMARYPELEVKLTAHTDARGSTDYNSWLSRKRAKAAKAFLVERGIDPNRIDTAGRGETMPLNDCMDGVDCSEIEHQLNRRTEVQITRFDRTKYEIHQHYNLPRVIDRMGNR